MSLIAKGSDRFTAQERTDQPAASDLGLDLAVENSGFAADADTYKAYR